MLKAQLIPFLAVLQIFSERRLLALQKWLKKVTAAFLSSTASLNFYEKC